jgi:putative spermidine/putrescine transport system permease protein
MEVPIADAPAKTRGGARTKTQGSQRRSWSYTLVSWLGLVPFLLFCLLFEVLPALVIVQGSFVDSYGVPTLNNYQRLLSQPSSLHAFQNSIELSLITALLSVVIGFFAARGVYQLREGSLRNLITGFSSIAANFAGVPLAFAFISTLGATGFITVIIEHLFHFNLYTSGFSIYSFWGLVISYTYFELPLMILVMVPALGAVRPEWNEAATNLGASSFIYWWRIELPVLMPSIIAAAMLLFANSLGAFATAYALAQGNINLITILISFVVSGNVNFDLGLGNALAVGMIIVLLIALTFYTFMLRRASIWQGR